MVPANEFCDRFATIGFNANLITYLTEELHMPLVKASNVLTYFAGTSSFMPVLGGFIADSYFGRFWMIIFGSLIYQMVVTFTPKLSPKKSKLYFVFYRL